MKVFLPLESAVCTLAGVEGKSVGNIIDVINVSYSDEWLLLYFNKNFQNVDPIVANHLTTSEPQIWSETYKKTAQLDKGFISLSQDFGLHDGLSYGITDHRNTLSSLFSFSCPNQTLSKHHVMLLKLLVPHLHQALLRVSFCEDHKQTYFGRNRHDNLTEREIEILNWLMLGKTNWEISKILKIGERTAKYHVSNIMKKLNAVTRTHAVVKAIERKIISL